MTGVQRIVVSPDEAEQRLDRWLRKHWPHLSQGRIERMCRKGEVRVDGARARAATRIAPGQTIRVPPLSVPDMPETTTPASVRRLEVPDGLVLHCDQELLVLNKPAGLPVQGGSKVRDHLGMILPALRFGYDDDPRLVHRLDRDTSGVLVLGRTEAAASGLAQQFRRRSVRKTYLALVAGRPATAEGRIRFGLVKRGPPGDERMEAVPPDAVATVPGARAADTLYRVVEQFASRAAIVALRPITGRTHQLRAHMAAIGCPIAGDGKYAGRDAENRGDGWGAGLGAGISRKLHLHAALLRFLRPGDGRQFEIAAPLPAHMLSTWRALGVSARPLDQDPFDV